MAWRLKPSIVELCAREKRKQKVSARELGRLTGVHHSQISRWFKGESDLGSEPAGKIMARLGITLQAPGK